MTEQIEQQPFWEAENLPEPGTSLSIEAYLQLPETNIAIELIDNIIVYPHWNRLTTTPAPLLSHQKLVGRIYSLLSQQPGTTYISPVDVRVSITTTLQPDVVWLAPESQSAEMETHLQGMPELVVEVLSPGTARRDKQDKFALYKANSAKEYWIVDAANRFIDVYTRKDETLTLLGTFDEEHNFKSTQVNMTVNVSNLFENM